MASVAHIVGNGRNAGLYTPTKGLKIACNYPHSAIDNLYATVMVDFKMMKAIHEGKLTIDGDWVLGARPKKWMEMRNDFHMKYARQIKEFYLVLPKYAPNYTDFNCGHMAVHWAANKLKREEIHMYGFDSIFGFDITSAVDLILPSPRDNLNTQRLTENWRPIWHHMFREFPKTNFIIHQQKGNALIKLPDNVEVRRPKGKVMSRELTKDSFEKLRNSS
tara:strand:- start:157 stop:813 length:657 start_codon:yes stop_codon:yes gene_type:complete